MAVVLGFDAGRGERSRAQPERRGPANREPRSRASAKRDLGGNAERRLSELNRRSAGRQSWNSRI